MLGNDSRKSAIHSTTEFLTALSPEELSERIKNNKGRAGGAVAVGSTGYILWIGENIKGYFDDERAAGLATATAEQACAGFEALQLHCSALQTSYDAIVLKCLQLWGYN